MKIFIFSLAIFDIDDLENIWSTDLQKHTVSPIIIEIKIIIGRALFYIFKKNLLKGGMQISAWLDSLLWEIFEIFSHSSWQNTTASQYFIN